VLEHIPRPSYVGSKGLPELCSVRQIHNAEGIAGMRAACKLAACVLDFAGKLVKVRSFFLWMAKLFFFLYFSQFIYVHIVITSSQSHFHCSHQLLLMKLTQQCII
jgi:hypothetical protein